MIIFTLIKYLNNEAYLIFEIEKREINKLIINIEDLTFFAIIFLLII